MVQIGTLNVYNEHKTTTPIKNETAVSFLKFVLVHIPIFSDRRSKTMNDRYV